MIWCHVTFIVAVQWADQPGLRETCRMIRAGRHVLKFVVTVPEVTFPAEAITRAAPGPRAVARPFESTVTTVASLESQEKLPTWLVMSVVP